MREFVQKRWVLLAVLLVFTILKLPHLPLPYYWDESWPYAVAIRTMYQHGISLLPNAMDGELSRGHPLFFHALGAAWMHVFGTSNAAMHSFALCISLIFLIAIYEAGLRVFNRRVAILALLLVAVQMSFFVQASFVLFDMLVALLCFVSIYFYSRRRYWLAMLCLAMLFYTKESGLIAGFVIGLDAMISLFSRQLPVRDRVMRLACVAVPCVLIGIFFILQKMERGWYILPLYNNLIKHDWDHFWFDFRINVLYTCFTLDYRYYYFLLLLSLAVLAAVKTRKISWLVYLLPGACIYYFVDDMRAGRIMPSVPFFATFVLSLAGMLYVMVKQRVLVTTPQKRMAILLVAFFFCYCCFSAMNFFTPRYMLAAIIPQLFIAAVILDAALAQTYRWLLYPLLAGIGCITAFNFAVSTDYGDTEPGAFRAVRVQQKVVDYFEQHRLYDKKIGALFLESQHLSDPATGCLHSDKRFTTLWDMGPATDYAVFDDIERDYRYADVSTDAKQWHRVVRYENGNVWAEIYKRNPGPPKK